MSIELIPDEKGVACYICPNGCDFTCFTSLDKFNHELISDHKMKTVYEGDEPFGLTRHDFEKSYMSGKMKPTADYRYKKDKEKLRREQRKNKGRSHE